MRNSDSTFPTIISSDMGHNVNDTQMLPVGATLQGGKYTVVAQLAHGGFGKTYKVWDADLEVYMALKELFISGINERRSGQMSVSLVSTTDNVQADQNSEIFQTQQRKFRSEARRLFKLLHPNIVRVHTCFDENGTSYYVMDYIDGESLSTRLSRLKRPLTEDELMPMLPEILSALEYIHDKSIWHLDLKPANIMVDAEGHPHLIDFGASKQLMVMDERTSTLSNMALTKGYAPPEQEAQDVEDLGPWTDFYALGATLYKLLTNVERLPSAAKLQVGYELTFPNGVSHRTRSLIRWMMKPSRVERPRSVEDIRAFLGGESQPATDVDNEKTIIEVVPQKPVKNDEETIIESEPPASSKKIAEPEVTTPKPTKSSSRFIIIALCAVVALGFGAWWFTIDKGEFENIVEPENEIQAENEIQTENEIQADDIEVKDEPYEPTTQPSAPSSQTFTVNDVSFKMIYVEGGTFTMGATPEQGSDAYDSEKPAHTVTLSSYYIGETEVTQALWKAVMGTTVLQQRDKVDTSRNLYGVGANYPMYYISWDDCQTFVKRLNELTANVRPSGRSFRLPTEAQWEFAARGGNIGKANEYKFSGDNTLDNVSWYDRNSDRQTHEVKSKNRNELGIYDMSGNVWEWCQDYYYDNYDDYTTLSQIDPKGPDSGSYRVFRGGSWYDIVRFCRVSNRRSLMPDDRHFNLGLRLAM